MRRLSEQAREENRRRVVSSVAIDGAIGVIAVACDLAHDEAVNALLDTLDAVPREQAENAWSAANLAGMGRDEAEAETSRLRDLVEEFLEGHPSGEHYWQADPEGGPIGWCKECLAEWPCLVERARAALHAEDGDNGE